VTLKSMILFAIARVRVYADYKAHRQNTTQWFKHVKVFISS